jgi:hypothetical protein
MKLKSKILLTAGFAVAFAALAALPTFKTITATGTTVAIGYFPADPNSQVRVVNINATSDNATGQVCCLTGYGAYYQAVTNSASSSVTNFINATNGIAVGETLLLQHAGACYPATVVSYGSYLMSTNTFGALVYAPFVKLGSGGWGVAASVYDDIYVMSNSLSYTIGSANSIQNGEAIFVGNYGRPVAIWVTGASSASLNSANAHYDQVGQ